TGSMGRPVMAAASVHWYRGQSYYDSAGWRGTWQLDGGGVLINQAIHTLDLLQFFMGPVKHVTAHKATLSHERIEVEDTAAAAIRFESGALGSFSCTTSAYPGYSNRLELFWTGGSAVMESDRLTHFYRRGDHNGNEPFNEAYGQAGHQADGASDPMGIRSDAHAMQLRDFIASIWDKRRPAVDGEEGRKALAFILASYKSSETGSTVCIQNQGE
ncbi:Gfo/Idh/MocA family oxidoreductase, partial [Paenibacillus sepulcri]|nr:Gfo/Idh/MocA family oxidoreductase [Paenibacillus sepulcri]